MIFTWNYYFFDPVLNFSPKTNFLLLFPFLRAISHHQHLYTQIDSCRSTGRELSIILQNIIHQLLSFYYCFWKPCHYFRPTRNSLFHVQRSATLYLAGRPWSALQWGNLAVSCLHIFPLTPPYLTNMTLNICPWLKGLHPNNTNQMCTHNQVGSTKLLGYPLLSLCLNKDSSSGHNS